jgi:hypothetical protein
MARHRMQRWHVVLTGNPCELACSIACRLDVTDPQHDLDISREQPGPPQPVGRLGNDAADGRLGSLRLTHAQPEQGQPWLRLLAPLAGPSVCILSRGGIAPHPI